MPSFTFTKEFIKVRFLEEGAPAGINARWLGMPRGVYVGFIPSVTPGSSILTLGVDPNHNFSLLKVGSSTERVQVDLFTNAAIQLDFAGHEQFPVYVLASADYKAKAPTQGRIFTRATPASGLREVLLCRISKPNDDLVVEATTPTTRQQPVAFQGQAFGYMLDDSVDQLADAGNAVSEIIAARTSPFTGAHPDLSTRLAADLSSEEMANRLGLRQTNVISNVHTDRSGSSANVSGSFSETNRTIAPMLTIESGGDESTEGAITDSGKNQCVVIDATTGQRLVEPSTGETIYGLLTNPAVGSVVGTINFFPALTSVTGVGGPFAAPLEEGDLVLAPDGLFYEIATIIDPNNATLGAAYQDATPASAVNPSIRRFELTFLTESKSSGVTIPSTDIQFVFPAFFRTDRAIFDGMLLLKRNGERPQVTDATESTPGKGLLATAGGLVGSIRTIRDNSVAVQTDVHTLNFDVPGAIVVPGASPGVLDVAIPGPTGPQGAPANQGPTGPGGVSGDGYRILHAFEGSAPSVPPPAPGVVTLSHNFDFSSSAPVLSQINWLFGGFSGFENPTPAGQTFEITNISQPTATEGQIDGQTTPGGSPGNVGLFALFLGASE